MAIELKAENWHWLVAPGGNYSIPPTLNSLKAIGHKPWLTDKT